MKKHSAILTFIFTTFLLSTSNVIAHDGFDKKFEKRQQNQVRHIKAGYRHGAFNFHELKRLIIAQHQLNNLSQQFYKDRHYAHKERRILNNKLNEMDKMIKRMSREGMRHNQHSRKQTKKHAKKLYWKHHSS